MRELLLPLRALFSYVAEQWDQVFQLQVKKGSWRSIVLPVAQSSIKPALHSSLQPPQPWKKALAERQPGTTTKQPFWAGALRAPIHLSLAQGPTANLGFSQLLREATDFHKISMSLTIWTLNLDSLFSPDWLKSANRLRSCAGRSGRGWQQDMKRGKKIRVKLTVFWHSK